MLIYLCFFLLAITLLLCFIKYTFCYWQRREIPHNVPLIPFGNVPRNGKKNLSTVFTDVYNKFKGSGPFAGFYFMTVKTVVALDQKLVKNVLISDFNNFADRGFFYNEKDDPLTANLFFIDGEMWRILRNKLTPTFTPAKMKYMFETVSKVAKELSLVFAEQVDAADGGVVEVSDLMCRMTTDVIGSVAFGLECNSLRNPEAEFIKYGKRFLTTPRHSWPINAFILGNPQLARKLGFAVIPQEVTDFYMRIVRETVAYREQNNIKRNDFMDMLIEMKNRENDQLTIEEVAAQAFVFFLAGFDTSSATMSFVLYELAQHQDIQDKLRADIRKVLAKHKQVISFECIQDMKYLEMVYSETLRLHPILGHLSRRADKRYETEDPKYYIEAGMTVIIPVIGIHQNPEYYPEPEKFKPDRFTTDEIKRRPACTWIPFGDGPRNCIGMRFGKMQMSLGLAYLLKDFHFSIAPETQIPVQKSIRSFTMAAANGVHLKVKRIL